MVEERLVTVKELSTLCKTDGSSLRIVLGRPEFEKFRKKARMESPGKFKILLRKVAAYLLCDEFKDLLIRYYKMRKNESMIKKVMEIQ